MTNRFFKYIMITALTLILTGCIFNTREEWNKLSDRKFYLSEFHFIMLAQNRDDSLEFFKKFPAKKLMFLIAREYNITVDMTEYSDLIKKGNSSAIETKGLLRSSENVWKTKNNMNNRIILYFNQDYLDPGIQKLKIAIYSGKSSLKTIEIEMSKIDSIFPQLSYHLPTSKEAITEYQEKNYDNTTPIPFIIEGRDSESVAAEKDGVVKIKSLIDEYVKNLDNNQKNAFKHDIIDYIYQKCN